MANLVEVNEEEMLQIGPNRNLVIGILSSINVLLDMIGALFFASIILVTIKHKKLHSACHFLIALFSLACFFNKTIFLAPFTMRIIVGGTLPLFICAFIQIIPLTFTFNIYPVLMAISIDRVFSIFFPIWYSHRNEFQFLVIFYSFTWIFPFYCIFATLSIVLSDPNSQSQCSYLDLIADNAVMKFHHALFFNLFIFCCYFLMSIKLYFKNQVSASTRQPLFKSLFLVMFLQLFGWTSSICAYAFILPEFSDEQRSYFVYLINYYASLTTTGEVLAIYLTSSVHRKALKKEIARLFGIFKENSNQQQNTIHIIRGSAQNWGNSTIQQIPKSN